MIFFQPINDISVKSTYNINILNSEDPKWGVSERLYSTFKKIKEDDLILSSFKNNIISIGIVKNIYTDSKIAKIFFPDTLHPSGKMVSYPHIIIFKKIIKSKINFEKFRIICGYSSNYFIRRLIPINEKGFQYFNIIDSDSKEIISKINQL